MPDLFGQILVNGLSISFAYILLAIGLTLVYGIVHVVNFAHGDILMIGSFVGLFVVLSPLGASSYWLAIVLAMVVTSVLGLILERLILRRLQGYFLRAALAVLGIQILLGSAAQIAFGPEARGMPGPFAGSMHIGSAVISYQRLVVIGVGLVSVIALYLFLRLTKQGQACYAVEQDAEAAALQGISIRKISRLVVVMGCALAGIAGVLVGPIYIVEPTMGFRVVVIGLTIIIMGGLGSLTGAIVAGFLVGFIDSITGTLIGAQAADISIFAVLVLILLLRPTGLLGHAVAAH